MIETQKLKKNFGHIQAVQGVSFRVKKGEVLGFLGPNGAGKSTVMRMLACFLTPTSGTATVGGHDIRSDSVAVRELIGYLPESNPVYGEMTTEAFLRFAAEMRGYRAQELKERIERVVQMCWLTDVRHQVIETLSKGYQRRVGLAQALIHDPPVLILDEPTDGLDPNQKHEVRSLIRQMAAEKAIIISTHILEEVEAACTRAIIIAKGRIVADGTPLELKQRSERYGAVRLVIDSNDEKTLTEVAKSLAALNGVRKVIQEETSKAFILLPDRKAAPDVTDVAQLARSKDWKVTDLSVQAGDLNRVFRDITTREAVSA
jgi:ABC-2 type transport system ATP-binding protein